jgi:peptide/nickel transport system substrate-binding protein
MAINNTLQLLPLWEKQFQKFKHFLSIIMVNIWRRIQVIFLSIILILPLNGCGSLIQARGQSQVVFSILSDPKTFNALLSQESPNIFGLTYEGLVRENPLTGEIEPALAKSWIFSEDKLKLNVTLKDNLKWSDGKNLTIDDVIFTYNQLYLNKEIPSNARDSLKVGRSGILPTVKKLNNQQVEFSIPEPFAPFLANLALPILPKHILQESVNKKDQEGKPLFLSKWGVDTPPQEIIVNGAYRLVSYVTNQRLIFEKNPYFWQKDDQGNQLPYIEKVVWQIVANTDTSLLQFRSGGLDSLGVSPEYYSLLKTEEKRGDFTIYNGGSAYGTTFIAFNLNTGKRDGKPLVDPIKSRWFNNVKFRQAVAHAIDRQRIINNIYRGLGEKQLSPISVQSPFYYQGLKGYDYNIAKSKQLLLEAGFKYDVEGNLLDENGNQVRFNLITNSGNKIREAMGAQIKQDLALIGIQVDFIPLAFNVLVDRLSNSLEWECHLLGLTGGNEPNDGANIWLTDGNLHLFNQNANPGSKPISDRNVSDWEKKIGQLYIQAAQELDLEKRKAIYAKTQRLAEEYLPFIYLVNPYSLSAVRNRIKGVQYSALGGAFWNIEKLTIED